eukprot:5406089-Prymnesium_polylepis.1
MLSLQLLDNVLCGSTQLPAAISPALSSADARDSSVAAIDGAQWRPVRRQLQPLLEQVLRTWTRDGRPYVVKACNAAARLLAWSHAETNWTELPIIC